MPPLTRSITIQRSVPDVFTYMDDVGREHEWQPNLREASQEPAGPVGVGTKKRYASMFMGKDILTVYRVSEYEMFIRVVYESLPESDVQARAEFAWVPVGAATQVTMTVDATPGGVLSLIPRPLLEKASIRELEGMLENLRRVLETT